MPGSLEKSGGHRTIVVVDVARFTDPIRTETHQLAVHEGLYALLRNAFDESGVPWESCRADDRGDGAIVYVRPEVPKARLVDGLPSRLLAGIRRHNATYAAEARIQLRVALNSGEVHENVNGVVSQAVNLACRLVDAEQAKTALTHGGVLALVVSDGFYQEVVRHEPAADPASYHRIDVAVKQTRATAWLRLPDGGVLAHPEPAPGFAPALGELFELVDALLAVPVMADGEGRQQLIGLLRPQIAGVVPYDRRARLHVLALVQACERYEGGLAELVTAVHALEGDSLPVRRLVDVASKRLSG